MEGFTPFKGNLETIDTLASDIRVKLQEKYDNVIRPDSFILKSFLYWTIESLGGSIKVASENEIADGSLVINPGQNFTIWLSPFTAPLRDIFTIGHELGHLVLHAPKLSEVKSQITYSRYGKSPLETQANQFSAGFLMPRQPFLEQAAKCNNNIQKLSSFFEVSSNACAVRLGWLNKHQ